MGRSVKHSKTAMYGKLLLLIAIGFFKGVFSNCADQADDCEQLATLCTDPNFKDIMKKRCPRTCNYCGCDDVKSDCEKLIDECQDPDFRDDMKKFCSKTCGFCSDAPVCADSAADCAQAASACNDTDLKDDMARRCPRTCGYCVSLECSDLGPDCEKLSEYCNETDFKDYMGKNCAKTCGLCVDWNYFNATNAWYKVVRPTESWNFTETVCTAVGGHLTSIHSKEENNFILEMLTSAKSIITVAWIGLYKDGNSTPWTDGSPSDFVNFADVKDGCFYMDVLFKMGKWSATACSASHYGICKTAAK